MAEPEEVQFACIGCGAMNPAGTEVCEGCGHRFAGELSGPMTGPKLGVAPAGSEPWSEPKFEESRPPSELSLLGCLGRLLGTTLVIIATIAAFGIAFLVTCTSLGDNANSIPLSLLAGLVASGVVIALAVAWVQTLRDR